LVDSHETRLGGSAAQAIVPVAKGDSCLNGGVPNTHR
jgi:hypothetical protein